jgi:hypothetical protein
VVKNLFCFLIFLFIISSCTTFSKRITVNINGAFKEIILRHDSENIYGIFLEICGNIIGEIEMEILRGDSDYVFKILLTNKNNFFELKGDYYSNIVTIKDLSKRQ